MTKPILQIIFIQLDSHKYCFENFPQEVEIAQEFFSRLSPVQSLTSFLLSGDSIVNRKTYN